MCRLRLLALLLAVTPVLRAQVVEIYGTVAYDHATSIPTQPPARQSVTSFAGGGGVTLNFLRLPGVQLGLDGRVASHAGNTGASTALGGVRLAAKPPFFRVKPWIEGAVGYLVTDALPSGSTRVTGTQYGVAEAFGGLDTPLLPLLSWRVIEIGGGRAFTSSYGSMPSLFTVGTGLVVHF